jgi:hypothetical protein
MAKTGSETMGAVGDKSKMTLFKDDRAEDIGAIVLSALVIAVVVVLSMKKPEPAPAPVAVEAAPAAAAPAAAEPAKTK